MLPNRAMQHTLANDDIEHCAINVCYRESRTTRAMKICCQIYYNGVSKGTNTRGKTRGKYVENKRKILS